MQKLALIAVATFVINLPFGFWREGTRKLSLPWFIAVHGPVPLVVGMRLASGLGWRPSSFVVLVAAYFAGQFAGGRLRRVSRSARRDGDP